MSEMRTTEYTPMQTLIRLVAAGARGEKVKDLRVDWQEVLPLTAEQHVQSLVACALLHSSELECPNELREHLLNAMRSESSGNLIRRQRIMHLLAEMKDAGIDAKVIKGYAVSGCYAHPECRGSVDTDLLIDVKQETAAIALLESKDFLVSIRGATSHHSVCQHKKFGMLELHVALYAELIRDIWFGEVSEADLVQEPCIESMDEYGQFVTLGYTDHLIFLTLHMIKHFILEGLTVRMMLDLALFFSRYRDSIDAERYWCIMNKLKYSRLVNCVLWSMIIHGGFDTAAFPGIMSYAPEEMQLILEDLIQGGYMGVNEKEERHKSGMEYNRQMLLKEKNQWQYALFMIQWKVKSGLNAMFPSFHKLRRKYPCAERNRLLLPFIWVYHVCSFPIQNRHKIAPGRDIQWDGHSENTIVHKRLELFRQMDMLDK